MIKKQSSIVCMALFLKFSAFLYNTPVICKNHAKFTNSQIHQEFHPF